MPPYNGYFGGYDYSGAAAYGYAPPADGSFKAPVPQQIDPKKEESKKQEARQSWYGNPNYQPAVYYYQTPTYTAPAANYYQPSPNYYDNYGYYQGYGYSYGGQQVPSYWHGY